MKKRAERLSALILIFVMLFSIISFSDFAEAKSSTGHLQIASTGQEAGALQATANIVLKENENIPAWTLVKVQVGPYEKTFPLFEAVNLMYIPNLQYKYDNVYLEGLAKKDLGLKEPEAVYGFNSGDEEVVQVFSRFTTTKLNAPTSKISEEYLTSMFPAEYINSIQTLNDLLPDDDTDGDGIPDSQDDDDDGDGIPDDKDGGFSPSPVGDGFGELVNSCPLPCDKYCGNGICDVCDCICMCYDNDNCNCECNNDGVCDSWEDQENCADCGECQTDEDCPDGQICKDDRCMESQCGNKVCESGECETCPDDCKPLDENCVCICGNDVCESRYSDPLDPGSGYGEIIIQPGSSGSDFQPGSSGSDSSGQQGQGYDCDETCKSCEEDCGACQCSCGDGYCNRDKGCEETSCNPEDNNEGKNCCNSDCVGELPTTVVTPGGVVNLMGVSPGLGKSYGDNEYSQYMGISGRGMPSLPNTKYNYITALSNIINVKSFAKGEIPTVFEFLASKPNGFTFDGQNIININTGERIAVRNLNEQIPRELQASATEVILNNYLTTGSIQGIQPAERLIGVESPIDQVARAYLAAKAGFKDADNYASLNNEVVSLGDVESSVDITTTGYTYTLNGQEITVATLAEIPSEYREEVAAVISVVAEIRTETPEGTTIVTTTETTGTTETTPTTTTTTTETTGGETTGGTEGGTTTGDTGGTTTGGDTGGGDRGGDTGAPTASIIKGTYREVTSFKETYKLGRQIVTEDLTANKKLYTTTQTYMKPTIIYVYPQLVPMLDINKVPKYTKTSRSEYLPDYYINLYADKNKNSILSATGYAGESTGENGKETHIIPIDLSLLGINLEQDGVYKMKVSLIFGNDVIDVQEKSIRVGDSPKKIGLKACSPNWICGDYDVCTPEYNFKGLSSADEIHYMIGVQRQYCYDSAGCTADEKVNERECIVKMNIETNVIEAEGRAYIEVYDADDNLLKVKMAVPGIGNNVVSLDLTPVGRISQFQK